MKKIFGALCVLLSVVGVLSSCLGDNETTVEVYSDTAITGVTLGTLNRYTYTTSKTTGNDTLVKATYTGSYYKLTIDQDSRTIYNQQELPIGTDLEHVLISSLSTKNGGVAYLKSLTSDTLYYITSTDSIDFSRPRTLRVYASDGSAYRDYTMTLTASQTTGVTFEWHKVLESDLLKDWENMHLLLVGDTVYLADKGTIVVNPEEAATARAMRVAEDGSIEYCYIANEGSEWIPVMGDKPGLATLIGATRHEIFAMGNDGRLKVCTDGIGWAWRDETLDNDASLLPTSGYEMVSWPYAPADSMDYVLLAGLNDADANHAVLWRKLSRYHAEGEATEGQWVYMPVDGENRYALPRQNALSMVYYKGSVLAVGSLLNILQSRDQGITWKKNATYTLPAGVEGTQVALTSGMYGQLWLITNAGQVWNGTLR